MIVAVETNGLRLEWLKWVWPFVILVLGFLLGVSASVAGR